MEGSNSEPVRSPKEPPIITVWDNLKKSAEGKRVKFGDIVIAVKDVTTTEHEKEIGVIKSVVEALIRAADLRRSTYKPLSEFAGRIVHSSEFRRMFHYGDRLALRNAALALESGEIGVGERLLNATKELFVSISRLFSPIETSDEYNGALLERQVQLLELKKKSHGKITKEMIEVFNLIKPAPGKELTEIEEKLNEKLVVISIELEVQSLTTSIQPDELDTLCKLGLILLSKKSDPQNIDQMFYTFSTAVAKAMELLSKIETNFGKVDALKNEYAKNQVDLRLRYAMEAVQHLEITINKAVTEMAQAAENERKKAPKIGERSWIDVPLGKRYLEQAERCKKLADRLAVASKRAREEFSKVVENLPSKSERGRRFSSSHFFRSVFFPSQDEDLVHKEQFNAQVALENARYAAEGLRKKT